MKQINFLLLFVMALSACSTPSAVPPGLITVTTLQTPIAPTQPPTIVASPMPTVINLPTAAIVTPVALPTAQRVNFQTGQTAASLTGKLAANGMDKWILRILVGQTLNVNLVPTNGKAKLTIVGADGTVLISDHADALQWSGAVPINQDYTITVLAFDNTTPNYTMQITIPPSAQPTSAFSPTPVAKRISFAPGGISATVQGVTPAVNVDRWVIAAQVGQTLMVNLVPAPGGQAAVVIYGMDGTVLISDHASAMQWSGTLPKTQDYIIDVKPESGSAVSYAIQVTIPPR